MYHENRRVKPAVITLLDSLADAIPDALDSYAQQMEYVHCSIRCNLENLLNTRKPELIWSPKCQELNQSILNYGITDLIGRDLSNKLLQIKFCEELANIIETFETRLQKVRVKLQETKLPLGRILYIRIDAMLITQVASEQVVFDSIFEPDMGHFRVMSID